MRFLILALLLTGCVTQNTPISVEPGKWSSYRDMLTGQTRALMAKDDAPEPVKDAYARCGADYIDKLMLPSERAEMDAYARGDRGMSWEEANRVDKAIKARAGFEMFTADNLGLLAETCPNDVTVVPSVLKL
jgi:hypothetical protein